MLNVGDGSLPARARRMLETVGRGSTVDEIVLGLQLPLFRVLSSLREAKAAGLVMEELGVYRLTFKGAAALRRSGAVAPELEGVE